ncbi:YjeF-related protein N-terminus-domain-containing protein [Xylariaceae sp. FL0662B]|nr:YjeF-related protein N-terminus-domain-containing protein [Xylariaceae sp. FL0662B]
MESSPVSQYLGGPYMVVLKEPEGERVHGILRNLIPEHHLTLETAMVMSTGQVFERLDISAKNVIDIMPAENPWPGMPSAATSVPVPAVSSAPQSLQDPAIVSMGHPRGHPRGDTNYRPPANTGEKRDPVPVLIPDPVPNPADRMTYSSPDETDTTELPPLDAPMTQLRISPPNLTQPPTTGDEVFDLTPTTSTTQPGGSRRDRPRGSRGKRQRKPKRLDDSGSPASNALPTKEGAGWRQTPILQSTKSFQPFAALKKSQKGRVDPNADNGWASEDVTDVQEAGDFDFEGGLAKFDKRTIFNEMRQRDEIAEADRLVSHNRLPRPKPGTAGGKNLHYTENVLDLPSGPKLNETPGDFWKSEADDEKLDGGGYQSGPGSGRSSRMRGESRVSTNRRSQSRKASAAASGGAPSRINSGQPTPPSALSGLYALPSNRRIETVTHLQMLVVENVAHNEFGLTEDLMAENAGRGISEVAMRALDDPAVKLRNAAASPPNSSTIVVLAGNHKSGVRAIAAARHLRNRGINILVCVVGIERERELLEDIRKQVRLMRNFGGVICTKSELFEHLSQTATTLTSSSQASITLIVDALLGLTISFEELRKSDQATTYELMEWANRNEAFVMAVDVPSGVDPSSGKVNVIDGAKLYVQPRYIVALGAPKQGLLRALEMGDDQGDILTIEEWKLYIADIGLGALVWRKAATKIRRGIDFDDRWVLELRYQRRMQQQD